MTSPHDSMSHGGADRRGMRVLPRAEHQIVGGIEQVVAQIPADELGHTVDADEAAHSGSSNIGTPSIVGSLKIYYVSNLCKHA